MVDPGPMICRNFRCVMCSRKGALFKHAGVEHDARTYAAFPADRQVGIGGARLSGESCNAQEHRCAALYESKRYIWGRYWPS
jgi:hypothetical protein